MAASYNGYYVKDDNLRSALEQIASLPKETYKPWLRNEVKGILQKLAKEDGSTISKVKSGIRAHYDLTKRKAAFVPLDFMRSYYAQGAPNTKWQPKLKNGRLVYVLTDKFPDNIWQGIKDWYKQKIEKYNPRAGLAKSVWVKAAQTLGLPISAAPSVMSSASELSQYQKIRVSVTEYNENMRYGIKVSTTTPYQRYIGTHALVAKTIGGRLAYQKRQVGDNIGRYITRIIKKYGS